MLIDDMYIPTFDFPALPLLFTWSFNSPDFYPPHDEIFKSARPLYLLEISCITTICDCLFDCLVYLLQLFEVVF